LILKEGIEGTTVRAVSDDDQLMGFTIDCRKFFKLMLRQKFINVCQTFDIIIQNEIILFDSKIVESCPASHKFSQFRSERIHVCSLNVQIFGGRSGLFGMGCILLGGFVEF